MWRFLIVMSLLVSPISYRYAEAQQQTLPRWFVGSWGVIDPGAQKPFTTVEMDQNGVFKQSGPFPRGYGAPNPLGANQWRFENGLLKFVYGQLGRARVDEMLVGAVRKTSDDDFQFTVSGGYYGRGQNTKMLFIFKRNASSSPFD